MEIQISTSHNVSAVQQMNISQLNELLGNVENFYYQVTQHGFFLPEQKKKTITVEYLYGVIMGKFFGIKSTDIRFGQTYKYVSKVDLYFELKKTTSKELGFDMNSLPNMSWILNVLFTLNPLHEFFHPPQALEPTRPFPVEFYFSNFILPDPFFFCKFF
jgi:hypothetical protein